MQTNNLVHVTQSPPTSSVRCRICNFTKLFCGNIWASSGCRYWRLVDLESPGSPRREADEICLSTHNYNACSTNVCQQKRVQLLLTTVEIVLSIKFPFSQLDQFENLLSESKFSWNPVNIDTSLWMCSCSRVGFDISRVSLVPQKWLERSSDQSVQAAHLQMDTDKVGSLWM